VIYEVDLEGAFDEILSSRTSSRNFERFANITRLDITAGENSRMLPRAGRAAQDRHGGQTYVYVRKRTACAGDHSEYDRKRDELLDEIASARHQIPIEHYTLTSNPLRRDLSSIRGASRLRMAAADCPSKSSAAS